MQFDNTNINIDALVNGEKQTFVINLYEDSEKHIAENYVNELKGKFDGLGIKYEFELLNSNINQTDIFADKERTILSIDKIAKKEDEPGFFNNFLNYISSSPEEKPTAKKEFILPTNYNGELQILLRRI